MVGLCRLIEDYVIHLGAHKVFATNIQAAVFIATLKQQAQALGLIHRWEEIKDMYHRVSMMFGDLIKVTPSSKVVGDMALFMVQNDLTEEDVYAKGDILDFPASVVEFFEGRIGTPYQGFPEKLQKLVLKGRAPISELL